MVGTEDNLLSTTIRAADEFDNDVRFPRSVEEAGGENSNQGLAVVGFGPKLRFLLS
jgi:hypothetical protein